MSLRTPRLGKKNIFYSAVVVALAALPVIGVPRQWILYLFLYSVYLSMANMWNLLAGYSGLLCLCPAAFIGLAGYTLILGTWVGIPMCFGILIGGIVAALFAVLISIPVFRLVGVYFAIATLVVPEALKYLFYIWRPMGGNLHGGGVFYLFQGHIEPNSAFNIRWLMTALLATVIGGISIKEGPMVGTLVVVALHFLLARYTGISLLIQGVLLCIIISLAPEGIIGFVRKTRTCHSLLKLVKVMKS